MEEDLVKYLGEGTSIYLGKSFFRLYNYKYTPAISYI